MPLHLVIPFGVFAFVVALGALLTRGRSDRAAVRARLEQVRAGRGQPVATPTSLNAAPKTSLARGFGWLGALKGLGGPSDNLRVLVKRAGYGGKHAAEVFFGVKVGVTVIGAGIGGLACLIAGLSMMHGMFAVFGGMVAGSLLPSFVLSQKVAKRTGEIRQGLPNAIDLLEVCVTAGMGVDQAWLAAAGEVRDATPSLADEMSLVNVEMLLGVRRAEALSNMAERTGADELGALSSIVTQADRFGTSMADALRTFAETMRETRSQKAEEAAEKMAIKLMLPMVIFIFPVVLLVSAGPAALQMVDMFET